MDESEPEPFLKRWSRRKQATVQRPSPADAAPPEGDAKRAPSVDGKEKPDALPPHIAALPPIETIAADTDIRAFLVKGVPAELQQAALRQAWSADPAIRDFVGMADYDWDFNASDAKPGFGPLEAGAELRRQVARILGEVTTDDSVAPATDAPSGTPPIDESRATPPADAAAIRQAPAPIGYLHNAPAPRMTAENPKDEHAAAQQSPHTPSTIPLATRKAHGRALPGSSRSDDP